MFRCTNLYNDDDDDDDDANTDPPEIVLIRSKAIKGEL